MQELQRLGLWGNGLIKVDSTELISRYNNCLVDMGCDPTTLDEFCIDCMGWSPEIAREKDNPYYLSHGDANQMAIIIVPHQKKCPIYVPFHSFDLDLMKKWFGAHKSQIVELTKSTGIWIYINQMIDMYHDSGDILLIDNIKVSTHTPSQLIKKADEQKKLVRQFMASSHDSSQMSTMLTTIPEKLKQSVEAVGGVAYRQMVIEDMPYSVPCSFYAQAFGGTFVFRSVDCEREKIITKGEAMQGVGVTSVADKKILRTLERFGLISYEVERWMKKIHRLKIIRDSFLIDVLEVYEPQMDFAVLSDVQKKEVMNRSEIRSALSEEYNLLDQLINKLQKGKIPKKISLKIKPYLAHPLKMIDKASQEAVWYILGLVCDGRPIVRLYRYDKNVFIQKYMSWQKPRQSWAIQCIRRYYNQKKST